MRLCKRFAIAMLCISASLIIGCGRPDSGTRNKQTNERNDDNKFLNLYIWADYLAPDTIASLEKLTGIRVRVSYFDNSETLESRMLTGSSGIVGKIRA
jgi:spermidine/putrescine-binding protein